MTPKSVRHERSSAAVEKQQSTTKQKPTLLIVDDDLGLQRHLTWTFDDYNVLFAVNRESALRLVTSASPPVITLDLGLPPDPDGGSEGLAALERIRQLAPHCKVI